MKIRQGFVSNSSSSSFLIYGINFSDVADLKARLTPEGLEDLAKEAEADEDDGDFFEIVEGLGLNFHYWRYGGMYIGESWDSVRDNETGAQFKARVLASLQEAGLKVEAKDLTTLAESWFDG